MTDNRRIIIRQTPSTLSFAMKTAEGVNFEPYPVNSSISIAANLREALRSVPMLKEPVNRAWVMVDSPVLMIPMDLFRADDVETFYHQAFTKQEQNVIRHAVLHELNCVAVFSVQKDFYRVCCDNYEDTLFMPAMAPVWRHLHQRSYTGPRQKLYAYCHETHIEIFAFVQNRFKFCNTYSANNSLDVLYYILSVWKQLAMVADHDELFIAGDIPYKEELQEKAKEFVKRVFYINPSGEFNRASVTQIDQMPYDLMVLLINDQ